MNQLFKTMSVMAIGAWSMNCLAMFEDKEDSKEKSIQAPQILPIEEKTMTTLGFNHFFEENHFLHSNSIIVKEKPYIWDVSENYRNHLKQNPQLNDRVLSQLKALDERFLDYPADHRNKIIGFSLKICGENISIQSFGHGKSW